MVGKGGHGRVRMPPIAASVDSTDVGGAARRGRATHQLRNGMVSGYLYHSPRLAFTAAMMQNTMFST